MALRFFIVILFITSSPLHAEVHLSGACKQKILHTLKSWGSKNKWTKVPAPGEIQQQLYYSPTAKVGHWIFLGQNLGSGDQEVEIMKKSPSTRLIARWIPPKCEPIFEEFSMETPPSLKPTDFSDNELAKLVEGEKKGAIFVFDPHMHLSLDAFERVAKVSQKLSIQLVTLRSPDSRPLGPGHDRALIQAKVLRSSDLFLRGMNVHYPSLLAWGPKGFAVNPLPGLKDEADYESYLLKNTQ